MESSKLLDPNINYFIIQNKDTYNANSSIEDQEHNIIGKIKQKGNITKHFQLLDSADSPICKLDKKSWAIVDTYEVKDSEGKILGIVKKKMLAMKLEMKMENSDGDIILISNGPYDDKCYEIKNNDGKVIGKFCFESKRSFFDKHLVGGIPSSTFLQITDNSFDRKILLGFFICLYNQITEDERPSDGAG